MLGGVFIVGGVVGSACFAVWVEKTHSYRVAVNVICLFAGLFTVGQFFFFKKAITWLSTALCFAQGSMMIAIMAVSFDFAVELTYPVGESFSSGVIMSAGQVGGIAYTLLTSQWLQDAKAQDKDGQPKNTDGAVKSWILILSACFASFFVSLLIRQTLKRLDKEKDLNAQQLL